MPDSTYLDPVLLTGDMLASLSGQPWQQANPGDSDFGIVMPNATALGDSSDLYRLVWTVNADSTATQFANGQGWSLQVYDPAADPDGSAGTGDDGWSTVPGYENMVPKDDLVSGLGAGDEYIVLDAGFGKFLLYDTNGGLPTTSTTLTYLAATEQGDALHGDNDGNLDFYDTYEAVACFATGTQIDTPTGLRWVETLRLGDLVSTRDRGPRPIAWVSVRHLSHAELVARPNLRPVRINAGALGPGQPVRRLVVSPQHRLLVRSRIAERMFGVDEVLVPAVRLTGLPGIGRITPAQGVSYHHFMFDRHEVIAANAAACESFFPGPESLRALPDPTREELFALFPELAAPVPGGRLIAARPLVAGRPARELIRRHRKHGRAPVAP